MRKINASDNIYITESTTGNLFSLTQEGAPLCRIIAKVSFMVSSQSDRPGESGRKQVWWEKLAQDISPGSSICLLCDLGRATSPLWAWMSPFLIVARPSDLSSHLREKLVPPESL